MESVLGVMTGPCQFSRPSGQIGPFGLKAKCHELPALEVTPLQHACQGTWTMKPFKQAGA